MGALVAKDGVGAGHFQRGCIVSAESDRRGRPHTLNAGRLG